MGANSRAQRVRGTLSAMFARAITAIAVLGAALACSQPKRVYEPPGTCQALFDRLSTCAGFKAEQSTFLARCEHYPVDFQLLKQCGAIDDCSEARLCLEKARARTNPKRRLKRLEKLVRKRDDAAAAGNWEAAEAACELLRIDPDPADTLKPCDSITEEAVSELTRKILTIRNNPKGATGHLNRCPDLVVYATRMSSADRSAAQLLCEEAELSLTTQRTLERVETLLRSPNPHLLAECSPTLKRLDDLDSPWAQDQREVVANRCFVRLATAVLALRAPEDEESCSSDVRRVQAAVKRYQPTDPILAKTLDSLAKTCR